MTNEEAKQWVLDHMAPDDDTKQSQVMRVVIKALEQQPCEDAISRKDMLAVFRQSNSLSQAWNGFEKLPSVTPKEKTGKWKMEDMFDGDVAYRCSECNELFWIESGTPKDNEYNFCPNCGVRMVSE